MPVELKLQVIPAGDETETERATVPVKPFRGATVNVAMAVEPALTDRPSIVQTPN